jgi:plastocyanin
MDDATATGLAIDIALKHRETKDVVRFSSPERRTEDPVYEMELLVEEPGAYKWTIQATPYPPLPMPTLHVLEPGSNAPALLLKPEHGDVTAEVLIDSQLYMPNQVSIAAGEAVMWTNEDEMTHQVAWQDLQLDDSELIKPGESLTMTFDRAGEFDYYCGPHPWMTGTVVVE